MKLSDMEAVRGMYDENAASYSKMMDGEIQLPVYRARLKRLSERIRAVQGALLDSACGSGHMLELYRKEFDANRALIGIDLSPLMVAITQKRLGEDARVLEGDMRSMPGIQSDSVAAVLNFFAVHHLDREGIKKSMSEWYRVLTMEGQLLLAAWEGSGTIDYGSESDIVALRYSPDDLARMAESFGFRNVQANIEEVEGFPMDAVYLECAKL